MKRQVRCPIDKVKEIILNEYPDYYSFDPNKKIKIINEFVKCLDIIDVYDYMEVRKAHVL